MQHPLRNLSPPSILVATMLAACGGGGGSSAPEPVVDAGIGVGDPLTRDACASDFYRNLEGPWEGVIVYDATPQNGSLCTWSVELDIETDSPGPDSCNITVDYASSVTQSVVQPATELAASECLESAGVFGVREPFIGVTLPEAGVDFNYPVDLQWVNGDEQSLSRGPYFGDPSVEREYVQLFDGLGGGTDRQLDVYPDRIEYSSDRRAIFGGVLVRPGE